MILNDKKISEDIETISSALKNNTHALLSHSKQLGVINLKIDSLYQKIGEAIADKVSMQNKLAQLEKGKTVS